MTSPPPAVQAPERPSPQSLTDLFVSFTILALQGFGGVVTVVQRELVDKKQWLTREEFVEDWAVSQVLPGPNVINLAIILGDRHFGWRGALAALGGLLFVPLILVLALAALFTSVATVPAAQGALRGMGAAAAGLITASGLKLISALKKNVMGALVCYVFAALAFAAAVMRVPLVFVILLLGGAACCWAYRQLNLSRARGAAE